MLEYLILIQEDGQARLMRGGSGDAIYQRQVGYR
jgi:hypothetical protein